MQETHPCYVASKPVEPNHDLEVTDKYSGEVVTRVPMVGPAELEQAIAAADAAAEPMRRLKAYQRQQVLYHCVEQFEKRFDELAMSLCMEAGKPLQHARGEVTRLIDTFRVAAEEAVRIYGEVMPLDISERAANYRGMWKRVPIGPCSFITPFNFPLNLVAHKVAPALAVGCPFVLKPATDTPIGALIIGEILSEADLPEGAFSVVTCRGRDSAPLVEDDRMKMLSFTGSQDVGWDLKARAGRKLVSLELGGNAAVVVDEGVDLDDAAGRIIHGSFYQSGQSCISVQRILIHQNVYRELVDKLVVAAKDLKTGDPKDEDTFIGPVIDDDAADRIEDWISSATSKGAKLLCGGGRDGRMIEPTLLEDVPADEPAYCDEVFGPAAGVQSFDDFDGAIAEVNHSRFGLQAGVFTRDIFKMQKAWDEIECGGIMINEVPSWRVDHMPYGGVKDSGLGREGLRFTMDKMTEIRLLVWRTPPSEQQ